MQTEALVLFVLGFVLLALVINLIITFRLVATVKYLRIESNNPEPLLPGTLIGEFEGQGLEDHSKISSTVIDSALVLLFLSAKCDKCKSKLPQIEGLIRSANGSGVLLRLLTNEPTRRFKKFLSSSELIKSSLSVDDATYDALNPQGASPYYLFVDDERVIQAAGFIGDENWLSFCEQIQMTQVEPPQ